MTYEQALQIAIEQLDDAVDYLRAMNKGFPRANKQIEEYGTASEILEAMQLHYEIERLRAKKKQIHEDLKDHLEKKRSHEEFLEDLEAWAKDDKREWVGLTDEDIEEVFTFPWHYIPFARAIEEKLKEKNT